MECTIAMRMFGKSIGQVLVGISLSQEVKVHMEGLMASGVVQEDGASYTHMAGGILCSY